MAFFNLTHLGPQDLFKTTSVGQSDANTSSDKTQRCHKDKEGTRENHTDIDTTSDITRDAVLCSTSNAINVEDELDRSPIVITPPENE